MFGAKCIKTTNGKTAAFYWKRSMVFKLDKVEFDQALSLDGAGLGTHLYAPEKQMKGWVSIPKKHSNKWAYFAEKALAFVGKLKR